MAEAEPTAVVNPFDATFSLLRGLQQEVQDLKAALAQEKEERVSDVTSLAAQLEEAKKSGARTRTESADQHGNITEIDDPLKIQLEKLEKQMEEANSSKIASIQKLQETLAAESTERTTACATISKKLGQEAAQWRSRCEQIDRAVAENKKMADAVLAKQKDRHDELVTEVTKHTSTLTNNRMSVDPFKHFTSIHRNDADWPNNDAINPASIRLPKVETKPEAGEPISS